MAHVSVIAKDAGRNDQLGVLKWITALETKLVKARLVSAIAGGATGGLVGLDAITFPSKNFEVISNV